MSDFQQQLRDATSKNQELLLVLSQTDYARPALKQTTAYITDLTSQIAAADKELQRLRHVTQDERKDHVKYRDSVVKRYAYKLGGQREKFTSRQEKEERDFLEAWQREREATDFRNELKRALQSAEGQKQTQSADVVKHDKAQAELDQLYNAIFSGPTPGVPLEDDMEQAVRNAQDWFQQCEMRSGTEKRAAESLERARNYLGQALGDMNEALRMSQIDMFGGGTFVDMMERGALSRAQNNLTQSLRSMDEARRHQSAIPQLVPVHIDHGHMISDALFDNIFTDMAQHDRIMNSQAQMQTAGQQLTTIRDEQLRRLRDATSQHKQASSQLDEARVELQRIRSEAFERFASQGGSLGSDAPPAYEA